MDWVKDNCENETRANTERFLTLFATGPDNCVFKNVFCGLCHGLSLEELTPWTVNTTNCPRKEDASIPSGWVPDFSNCLRYVQIPPSLQGDDPHLCFPDSISSCPPINISSPQIQHANSNVCENTVAKIMHISDKTIFKNIGCCECNWKVGSPNCSQHTCFFNRPYFVRVRASLGVIFKFNQNHAYDTLFESRAVFFRTVIGHLGNCSSGLIYDPFDDICRQLRNEGKNYFGGSASGVRTILSADETVSCFAAALPLQLKKDQMSLIAVTLEEWIKDIHKDYSPRASLSNHSYVLVVNPTFNISSYVQMSLSSFVELSLNQNYSLPCGINRVAMIIASRQASAKLRTPTCEGYTLEGINLSNLYLHDDYFYVRIRSTEYRQKDLIHMTTYEIRNTTVGSLVTRRETLKLCNPFLIEGTCDVFAIWSQDEFKTQDPTTQSIVHPVSGRIFKWAEYWKLPNGTILVCNSIKDIYMLPESLHKLSNAGGALSLIGLAATTITYARFPSLQTLPGKCLLQLTIAMGVAQVALLLEGITISWLCSVRAYILHASWLSVFLWMNVLTGHLAFKMKRRCVPNRHVHVEGTLLWKFCMYAWGCPVLFVSGCFIASKVSLGREGWLQYGGTYCWIQDPFHSLLLFGIPVLLVIVVNTIFLAYMMKVVLLNRRSINQGREAGQQLRRSKQRSDMLLCFKVSIENRVACRFSCSLLQN